MCDCIEKVNGLIKDKGERLAINILFDDSPARPFISTIKLSNGKQGKVNLIIEFCPFCGGKYEIPHYYVSRS